MPEITVTIKTKCGAKTCAVKRGKFCRYLRCDIVGNCICANPVFGASGIILRDENQWVQRHGECIKKYGE